MANDQLRDALDIIGAVTSDLDYALAVCDYEDEDTSDLAELHHKLDQLLGEFEDKKRKHFDDVEVVVEKKLIFHF